MFSAQDIGRRTDAADETGPSDALPGAVGELQGAGALRGTVAATPPCHQGHEMEGVQGALAEGRIRIHARLDECVKTVKLVLP